MRFMSKTSLCITGVVSLFLFTNLDIFSAVPWTDSDVVRYPLPMTIIGKVEILGNPAEADDVVAVLSGTEVVGLSSVVDVSGRKLVNLTMGINPKEKSFSIDSATGEFVFDAGDEEFTFKVWDKSTDTTYTAIQTPIPSAGKNLGDFAGNNLFSIEVKAEVTQVIQLAQGWNNISLNIRIDDMSPGNVFSGIIDDVNKIISGTKIYDPKFDTPALEVLNALKVLSDGIGFFVNVDGTPTLTVSGRSTDPLTEISLNSGWNNVAYVLNDDSLKIGVALADIIANSSNLIKVISGPNIYDPELDTPQLDVLNSLKTFKAGDGFWIRVNNAQKFIFKTQ